MATPESENDLTNSIEVLPALHRGLKSLVKEREIIALGVAENVTVALEGNKPTHAIKVLFEHKNGFSVALYLPFEKKLLKGFIFGNTFSHDAKSEINAWEN